MLQMNNHARPFSKSTNAQHASMILSADASSVAEGRRFVRNQLSEWGLGAIRDAVVLVASELITNVLLHTDSTPTVYLTSDGNHLRLGIADGSSYIPRLRSYANESTTGRGMVLVESMTTSWCVEPHPEGKVVWCDFDVD